MSALEERSKSATSFIFIENKNMTPMLLPEDDYAYTSKVRIQSQCLEAMPSPRRTLNDSTKPTYGLETSVFTPTRHKDPLVTISQTDHKAKIKLPRITKTEIRSNLVSKELHNYTKELMEKFNLSPEKKSERA
jgi:hypothetical protein